MALNESSNLLRKCGNRSPFERRRDLHFFSLLLSVSAAHYHHSHSQYRHQNSIPETQDIHPFDRLGSSAQSLQTIFSISKPSRSSFDPQLQQFAFKTPSTSAIPSSVYKSPTTYTSLCHINNLSSHPRSSLLKNLVHQETVNKSCDDYTISSHVSNMTPTIPSEINPNDRHQSIEVRVRCIFLRVGEIDTLNERYTGEIFFEASWYAQDPKTESKYDPQMGHFNPQLVVLNNIGESLRHEVSAKDTLRSGRHRALSCHVRISLSETHQRVADWTSRDDQWNPAMSACSRHLKEYPHPSSQLFSVTASRYRTANNPRYRKIMTSPVIVRLHVRQSESEIISHRMFDGLKDNESRCSVLPTRNGTP